MRLTPEMLREGRERLERLLPQARLDAEEMVRNGEVRIGSGVGRATANHLHAANFLALVVYPAPKGGWHCDLMLKSVPPGLSDTVGSPVETPFEARFQAEEYAPGLLAMAIAIGTLRGDGKIEDAPPSFRLHDVEFPLPPEVVAKAAMLLNKYGLDGDRDQEIAVLREVLVMLGLDQACTTKDVDQLNTEQFIMLTAALCAAVSAGLFNWPPREDKPPSEDGPVITLKPGETVEDALKRRFGP